MKEFIFYTGEGYTESPKGEVVENYQILGFERAKNMKEALNQLLNNNPWIEESGFEAVEIVGMEINRAIIA